MLKKSCLLAAISVLSISTPAMAGVGDPIPLGDDLVMDITANARVRYETVDQDNALGNADALTVRARVGATFSAWGIQMLVEGEGTTALVDDFNDTLPGNGVEPFSVVADPDNLELNRAQISYMKDGSGITLGRQRIIMGNARFVGNVGWRQNEQTFDAVRAQAKLGVVNFDGVYATSNRTIFGVDSPNEHFDGDMFLLNAGLDLEAVDVTAFAYILEFDTRAAFSSETFGLTASTAIPLGSTNVTLSATYATQSDADLNPANYTADFISVTAGVGVAGFNLSANYEELGSDGGVAAFQTPLATLHAFQGWADIFLTTPAAGVRDYNASIARQFALPGIGNVNAAVAYHKFESDFGSVSYGSEWDASLGFRLAGVGMLLKYANYNSSGFSVDTQKLWLQAEFGF
ncbi:alginate export family protein [Alteraurantiacibacter aestuarii]|uniref:Alginate export domain-containing protein n=1 Tax=Alteraurantiacibacter aestuarii TaxID=650004 RepID=A0A844ZR52_9SPHN|nr:alginate export family protein [Alteraurantiacibacter aestuarii]MXO88089.1 hypothetical protein [Alteraurantiacibacter aestuarii]